MVSVRRGVLRCLVEDDENGQLVVGDLSMLKSRFFTP